MSFRSVFIAIVIGFSLIVGAFLLNRARPRLETEQPNAAFIRATGKCAECHYTQTYSVVHEYELSVHARKNVNCLDCHQPAPGQEKVEHHNFVIAKHLTPGNCRSCHESIYQEFLRSRHAAPAWAAIYGEQGLTSEQVNFSEQFQPGGTRRPPHPFAKLEGGTAMAGGCEQCHSVGRPNSDGSIGTCTACHSRHTSSVGLARLPSTCGQCHMGPDHSQIEIYDESKHGILFAAQRVLLNLNADSRTLTTHDMFVPTCATCHMSGINGQHFTHDPSERLSYYLANTITQERPDAERRRTAMKQICIQCHTAGQANDVYARGAKVVADANAKVKEASDLMDALRKEGVLTGPPFSHPIEFVYFDLWHYDGRTAKHGAFMGGADFVQWHGNYPMLTKMVELRAMADELRRQHASAK